MVGAKGSFEQKYPEGNFGRAKTKSRDCQGLGDRTGSAAFRRTFFSP